MYADWKSQVAYTSPNFNGFNFTAGVTQAWNAQSADLDATSAVDLASATSTGRGGAQPAFEGKVSYTLAGPITTKVWSSAITQKVEGLTAVTAKTAKAATDLGDDRATAWDVGTTVNVAGFGLTAYYGQGSGIGQTVQLNQGFDIRGNDRDSDQWYLQGTFTIPGAGTKLGVSYGESTLEGNSGADAFDEIEDSMWTVGAYHPITKHLNLVAEYSNTERDVDNFVGAGAKAEAKTISLGAILFF
jgi:hypothetical protein